MSDRDLVDAILDEENEGSKSSESSKKSKKDEAHAAFCLFHHKFIKLFSYLSGVYSKLRYDAADIATDMYIHLSGDNWRRLRSFEFKSSLFGWLKVVTNRYLLNEMEKISPCVKCKNEETSCAVCKKAPIKDVLFFSCLIEQEGDGRNTAESIPDPAETHVQIDERLYDVYLIEELYKEMDTLSDRMREVIRLRYLVGLSSKETADVINRLGKLEKSVTPGAVDQLCKRAKDTIREKINQRTGGI